MAVVKKKGCLIEGFKNGEVQIIGHQANCQNTMNSGVAKALRAEWPQVYEADCQTKAGDITKLGTLSFTVCEHGSIFNLYGQYKYGREKGVTYTDLEALGTAMHTMRLFVDQAVEMGICKAVGFPKLGAGLGGAKWADVEALIEKNFAGIDVIVYTN